MTLVDYRPNLPRVVVAFSVRAGQQLPANPFRPPTEAEAEHLLRVVPRRTGTDE